MADAGGVVYLLSSYQSGRERWGARGEGVIQEEKEAGWQGEREGEGENTLFQTRQQLLLRIQRAAPCAAFWFGEIHVSRLTLLMWEISD